MSAGRARPSPRTICAPSIPPAKKTHHLQLKVGHYGVFHGRRWQTETYPKVKSFIRAQD